MPRVNDIQRDILSGLEPRDRVVALLRTRTQKTPREFAIAHGILLNQLYSVMRGAIAGHSIRDALADEIGIERPELDALIDGEPAATAAAG